MNRITEEETPYHEHIINLKRSVEVVPDMIAHAHALLGGELPEAIKAGVKFRCMEPEIYERFARNGFRRDAQKAMKSAAQVLADIQAAVQMLKVLLAPDAEKCLCPSPQKLPTSKYSMNKKKSLSKKGKL